MIIVWWNKWRDEYFRNIGRLDEVDSRNVSCELVVVFLISLFVVKVCFCIVKFFISNDNIVMDICKLWVEINVGVGLFFDFVNCYFFIFLVFFGICRFRIGIFFDFVIMYLDMYWIYVFCIFYSLLVLIYVVNIYFLLFVFNFSCDLVLYWSDVFGFLKWFGIFL